jgi:phosphohistidine swiveling domain-containing protein
LESFGGLVQQTLSIIVGNQTVVKNLPIQFNQGVNGQAFDRLHENAGVITDDQAATSTAQVIQPVEIRLAY